MLDAAKVSQWSSPRTGRAPARTRYSPVPPNALPFAFGPDSFEAHLGPPAGVTLEVRVCERPHLAFDLDTAGDLRASHRPGRRTREGTEVIGVEGFPEIRPGDDLNV